MDDTPNEHMVECIFRGLDPIYNALKPYSGGISVELYPAIRTMNTAFDDEIDRIVAGVWDRGSFPAGRESYVRGYLDSEILPAVTEPYANNGIVARGVEYVVFWAVRESTSTLRLGEAHPMNRVRRGVERVTRVVVWAMEDAYAWPTPLGVEPPHPELSAYVEFWATNVIG